MKTPRWPFCSALSSRPEARPVLPTAGRADEDDVLGLGDEVQFGEGADLALVDAGLALEGEGLEGPLLGQPARFDPPGERALLAVLPLGAQQPREEFLEGQLLLVGLGQLRRRGSRRSCRGAGS